VNYRPKTKQHQLEI